MRPQPLGPGPGGREAPASRHPFSLRDGAGTRGQNKRRRVAEQLRTCISILHKWTICQNNDSLRLFFFGRAARLEGS